MRKKGKEKGEKKGIHIMMKKITKRLWEKKNSKKGFTLVELIVVLVILAILAAMMVPALTKWIDKAKEKQVALEARSVYLAAQTIASEDYAETKGYFEVNDGNVTATGDGIAAILDLADADADAALSSVTVDSSYKVTDMEYVSADGRTATLTAGVWSYE